MVSNSFFKKGAIPADNVRSSRLKVRGCDSQGKLANRLVANQATRRETVELGGRNSLTPVEMNRDLDVRMQTLVNRAGQGCFFKGALFRMSRRKRDRNIHG
jgi:hypothetical protein